MARAISRAMSMSKPSSCPVAGLRKPNKYVFWSTPTMSLPRSAMAAIVESRGMAPGAGRGPGRQLASRSQSALPAAGTVVTSSVPPGRASIGVTDTNGGAVAAEPHPAVSATASSATMTRALIRTP